MIPSPALDLLARIVTSPTLLENLPDREAVSGWPFAYTLGWIQGVELVTITDKGRRALVGHMRWLEATK